MPQESRRAVPSTREPRAASLPNKTRLSVPVQPDIIFQWEPCSTVAREMLPLLRRQDTELMPDREAVPFDPDWDRYFEYERLGLLHVLTARANGVLIGYVNCLVIHSLLCRSVVHGYAEHFWLSPEWRGGGTGRHMLQEAERGMAERGAKVTRFDTNDLFEPDQHGRSRVGLILRRMGYRPIVTIWQKVINDVRRR